MIDQFLLDICENQDQATHMGAVLINNIKLQLDLDPGVSGDEEATRILTKILSQIQKDTKNYHGDLNTADFINRFTKILSKIMLEREKEKREKILLELIISEVLHLYHGDEQSVRDIVKIIFARRKKQQKQIDIMDRESILTDIRREMRKRGENKELARETGAYTGLSEAIRGYIDHVIDPQPRGIVGVNKFGEHRKDEDAMNGSGIVERGMGLLSGLNRNKKN